MGVSQLLGCVCLGCPPPKVYAYDNWPTDQPPESIFTGKS